MAEYPGAGSQMSNYGLKVRTPEELKLLWGGDCEGKKQAHHAITRDVVWGTGDRVREDTSLVESLRPLYDIYIYATPCS